MAHSTGIDSSFDDKTKDLVEVEDLVSEDRNVYTKEEERRVVRKIDMVIMPLMAFTFLLQYMDKQSLGYAAVFGLQTDLKLQSWQYSWTSSIFFLGQFISEYPYIYLMSRFRLTRLVGLTIVVWGAICMCLAAPKSYMGFAIVRFFLGVAEGCVSPAFVTLSSIWYRKSEHPLRIGIWLTMNCLAQIIGSLLMYGIGKNSHLSISPWRVLFLLLGALTMVDGLLFYFLMPSSPDKAWFLNEREKEVLKLRMAADHDGGDHTHFSLKQFKESLLDVKTYFYLIFGILLTMPTPVLIFATLVISGLGYDKYTTMLYGCPSGAVQMVFLWIGIGACQLFPRRRCLVLMLLTIPPLVGTILLKQLPISAGWGIVVSSWLASCIVHIMGLLLSLSASNVKGNTKRAVVNAVFFVGYCTGGLAAPQLWTHAPRYTQGVTTSIITWCLMNLFVGSYWALNAYQNKQKDREIAEHPEGFGYHPGDDITDKQDRTFKYSL